jgi:hypothetical protein
MKGKYFPETRQRKLWIQIRYFWQVIFSQLRFFFWAHTETLVPPFVL